MQITLQKMNIDQFEDFRKSNIKNFANDLAKARDITINDALDIAMNIVDRQLSKGIDTDHHYFFQISNSTQQNIGHVWYEIQRDTTLFIWDIEIYPEFRGQKFGEAAMKEVIVQGQKHKIRAVELNVFESNQVAKKLYEKIGFEVISSRMKKNVA